VLADDSKSLGAMVVQAANNNNNTVFI